MYANKMDNLEEMDRFLEKLNLPKLNKAEIENMNRSITSIRNQSCDKKIFQQTKAQGQIPSQVFYQRLREELTPIFLRFFQKIAEDENSQTHSMRPPLP